MGGSRKSHLGGGIVALETSRADRGTFVEKDPFVAEQVVTAEVLEITPAHLDDRLEFLAA